MVLEKLTAQAYAEAYDEADQYAFDAVLGNISGSTTGVLDPLLQPLPCVNTGGIVGPLLQYTRVFNSSFVGTLHVVLLAKPPDGIEFRLLQVA